MRPVSRRSDLLKDMVPKSQEFLKTGFCQPVMTTLSPWGSGRGCHFGVWGAQDSIGDFKSTLSLSKKQFGATEKAKKYKVTISVNEITFYPDNGAGVGVGGGVWILILLHHLPVRSFSMNSSVHVTGPFLTQRPPRPLAAHSHCLSGPRASVLFVCFSFSCRHLVPLRSSSGSLGDLSLPTRWPFLLPLLPVAW